MNTISTDQLFAKLVEIQEEMRELKTLFSNGHQKFEAKNTLFDGGWILRKEAMELLGYGSTTFYTLVKEKKIIISKIGKRIFVKKDSIQDYLNNNVVS